ncbi:MAG TPA: hypothetical protein VLN58_13570 [Verrucomicrobiae bacterium]|nr:hypothetical protein [Verrucomicrobiae bacterium]
MIFFFFCKALTNVHAALKLVTAEGQPEKAKEPTAARLRSLQAVLKTLLESPHISQRIDANYVHKTGFSGNSFTDLECRVVANLANSLRPYVPKRRIRPEGSGTEASLAHVALRAPLVIISNTLLRATGYHPFTRRISPQISPAAVHALSLGATGMFEVFASRGEPVKEETEDVALKQFDVVGADLNPITNISMITAIPANKRAIFASFFDIARIDKSCQAHGLRFANR